MGLAQKRIITEFKEQEFPKWKSQFDSAAGFDLPIDIKWETLSDDSYDDKNLYFRSFEKVFFRPLLTVIKNICIDDMGRTALREHMKKITWDGTTGSSASASTFDAGHLLIKHKPLSNVDQENERIRSWQKIIEQKL